MDDSNFVVMINNLYIRWYYDNNYENIKKKQRKKKHMINGNDKWYISTEYKKKNCSTMTCYTAVFINHNVIIFVIAIIILLEILFFILKLNISSCQQIGSFNYYIIKLNLIT